jgi:UDP-N-acetylmuramoylalanine--D-glutamate ligase
MKLRPPLPPGPYLVVGSGLSGTSVASLLDDVTLVDNDREGMKYLDRVGTVVKSPGIRPSVELIRKARERGMPVVGELEIAWRLLPNEFIAVTGTNGKTTTTALLGEIHRAAGITHAVAGNIGTALSSLVGRIASDAVVICECSSFQLADSLEFAPECAVLLNVDADHLDWHGSIDEYRAAKQRIFANQGPDDVAVVPAGYDGGLAARRVEYSAAPAEVVRLRGRHNLLNAGAAWAVARARGIPDEATKEALSSFAGVPHRLEEVAIVGGVAFVNDSKATNVASTLVALESFDGGVHVILGGDDAKGEDFRALRSPVEAVCAAAYLIGEAAPRLRQALEGATELHDCGTLHAAVAAASAAAREGDVVLLSPACASYDQFRNFEERGDHFRDLVRRLGT